MSDISYTLLIDNAPASAEVLKAVQLLEVDDSQDKASAFLIRFGIGSTPGGDWSILADDLFDPLTPVSVRLNIGSGLGEPLIQGYVTSVGVEFAEDPGQSYLEVSGMDATVKMNLEEKVRTWTNMADSDIANLIFGEYELVPEVESTSPNRVEDEVTTIQRTTDIRFLRRLAARNGYSCYVEPGSMPGVENGYFAPLKLSATAQGVLSMRFGAKSNVGKLTIEHEMLRPTTAKAGGIQISGKSTQSTEITSVSETALGSEVALAPISPQPVVLPSQNGLFETGELQSAAQAVVDRAAWAILAKGTLNVSVYGKALRARKPVNLRGLGSDYSGTYMVRRVLHKFSGEEYTQEFELVRNATGVTGSESFVQQDALAGVG